MNWKLIPKYKTEQPQKGNYTKWKSILAKEGFYQCVYCSIHDSRFGGIRNFHVEHFRPKSLFKELTNIITNLFYACPICNTFKGKDWQNYPEIENFDKTYYPDPSKVDYSKLFSHIKESGLIKGNFVISNFLIQKLVLNRNQLILERRFQTLLSTLDETRKEYYKYKSQLISLIKQKDDEAIIHLEKLLEEIDLITETYMALQKTSPYKDEDTKK